MSMKDEFKAFIMKGNVVDLAIAVVIGGAFGKIITAFVDGLVMPLVTTVLPANIKWEEWVLGKFRIGTVLGATVNFLIIALVVFLVLIKFLGRFIKKEEAAPTTKECPACLEQVPLKATRCKYCTSQL
ncbi:large conductance mechanosensitive channel protein MscL [Geothrix edaphica]|uniref:Large-conductance mechanosensitive channel n=1 Tax=Geothrix edaphica TaxID=2927976 RepID=A0ABQ5PWU2_9BACT|nr:large conductance mechanosensitive channel protein MscL [Geothrix edaphica]GLH66843.1 large-conductance mechanosensitive channel [Geothrix edaphica]